MTAPEIPGPTPGPTPSEVELIEARLHEATRGVPLPASTVREHLERGRRKVRRRRLVAAGAAAATVVLVSVGAAVVGPSGSGGSTAASSGPDRAVDPEEPTDASRPGDRSEPDPPVSAVPPDARTDKQLVQAYRDVIAEYVDPAGDHLQRVPDNQQSGGGLGTKLGWSNPGEEGLGVVQVFVSASWDDQWYMWCTGTQECSDLRVGDIEARVLREPDETWVGVRRGDGTVVALSASTLFGNNSLVPVSDVDVSEADLARIAADPRLVLPGGR